MLNYIISGVAAINTHVVALLILRKIGVCLSPLSNLLDFVVSWVIAFILFYAYSFAIEKAAQHGVQADGATVAENK